MQKIESYTVPLLEKPKRFQEIAGGIFTKISTRSGVKKAAKKKLIKVNGISISPSTMLYGGEQIDLYQNEKANQNPVIDITIPVIYEDDYLALVNKPAGITVSGNKIWTLENALAKNLKTSNASDKLLRPEPIHRLDNPTSGIILIGKTRAAVIALNKIFAERAVEKIYYAVTTGKMDTHGTINTPVDGKNSRSDFVSKEVLNSDKYEHLNLIQLHPHTGRKHQLRKHLASIGHPIMGDKTYGTPGKIHQGNGLYLHAYSLGFTHPITNEKIKFTAKPPKKFTRLFPDYNF